MTVFKDRLYRYGLVAGLPFGCVKLIADGLDIARQPAKVIRRKLTARRLLNGSPWRGAMPRDAGAVLVTPENWPGLKSLAEVGAKLHAGRAHQFVGLTGEPFYDLLTPTDLRGHTIFEAVAHNRDLIEIIADYLGTMPVLVKIMLGVTPGRAGIGQSQLYHLDKPDVGFVQLFINVLPTGPENGPLTFLPADVSARVRRATAYDRNGAGRLTDAEVYAHAKPSDAIAVVGAPGSGVIIDTSRCLHFGSRTAVPPRVVCIIQLAPAHKIRGHYRR